jgi:hypothetical protein
MGKKPFVCPNCGEEVPADARACPNCGSDENTGWSEGTYLDGIDLPFEDDEYETLRAKEFGGGSGADGKEKTRANWMMVIGAIVAVAMLFALVFRGL